MMANDVNAVIAALKTVLKEAEGRSSPTSWPSRACNRWIDQLPGAWFGRWRHLKIHGSAWDDVPRAEFIAHVRATIAYLEANRESIAVMRSWIWRRPTVPAAVVEEPVDAEFTDVEPRKRKKLQAPANKLRAIK